MPNASSRDWWAYYYNRHVTDYTADLNTLIGRPPDAPADPTDSFEGGSLPADIAGAVAASPDVVALDREIDEAVALERLAETLRIPDTTVSGGVLFDSPPEFNYGWKAGVAVTLPIFTRHTADVRVESAKVIQLRAQREARIRLRALGIASNERSSED